MENDLISRKWLHETFDMVCSNEVLRKQIYLYIDAAPAIDAVEVVRCTECRFQNTCKRTIEICPKQNGTGSLEGHLHGCEYGVRRKDHGK